MCESMTEAEKLLTLITDARKHGVTVLPPDVNASDFNFTAPDTKTIRYGLGGIKGVGEEPANAISLERRRNGPFKDLFDMAERVGPKARTNGFWKPWRWPVPLIPSIRTGICGTSMRRRQ